MRLKAENKNPKIKDMPQVGTHMGRLVGLTDLGHQPGFQFKGNDIPSSFKIEFTYELPNSRTQDGRPHWISEEVKVNSFEGKGITSTMMARVRTIDPNNDSEDGDDLTALLTKPCMITVSENENGYPRLKGQACISGIPMGMEVPELENPSFCFDMNDPDMDVWEGFSEFMKQKIQRALDYDESKLKQELVLEASM